VLAEAPRAKLAPRVVRPPGLLEPGSKLEVRAARFSGTDPLTISIQWLRCSKAGDRCRAIKNATGETFALTKADVARKGKLRAPIAVAMIARNSAGTVTSTSPPLYGNVSITPRVAFRRPVAAPGGVTVEVSCKGGRPQPCAGTLYAVASKRQGRIALDLPAGTRAPVTIAVPGLPRKPGNVRFRFRPADDNAGKAVVRTLEVRPAPAAPKPG
jgi:hypothetical protein